MTKSENFINNKYTRWYFLIIERARINTLLTETYTELHHVIPKSLGGANKKENLVRLTARAHFVCHLLLTKMLSNGSAEQRKMIFALHKMAHSKNAKHYKITSYLYEQLRILFSKNRTGVKHPQKQNENISKALTGLSKTPEHVANLKLAQAHTNAKPEVHERKRRAQNMPEVHEKRIATMIETCKLPEVKEKKSAAMKGVWENPEFRQKITRTRYKAIEQIDPDTGVVINVFASGKEASKALKVSTAKISMCANGFISTVGGFTLRFKEKITVIDEHGAHHNFSMFRDAAKFVSSRSTWTKRYVAVCIARRQPSLNTFKFVYKD